MRNTGQLLVLLAMGAASCVAVWATTGLATVTSAEPFTLDGQAVSSGVGLNSSALALGSEVATSSGPAVLLFADGSSVKLASASRAKLAGSEAQPKVILLSGSLDYKVVLGSNLSVTSLDLERKAKPATRSVRPAAKPLPTPRADSITLTTDPR